MVTIRGVLSAKIFKPDKISRQNGAARARATVDPLRENTRGRDATRSYILASAATDGVHHVRLG